MTQRSTSRWIVTAVATALACVAGCVGPERPRGEEDPMLGGRPIPIAKANNTRPASDDDPLLLPPSDAGSSPAALTNDAERNTKRDEAPPNQTSSAPTPPAKEVALAKDAPKEIATAGFTSAPETYEQLQQQLQTRGVTWQQLKRVGSGGDWTFSCGIPDPQQRGIEATYHGKATGKYGLEAIKAALAEIETDRKQRGER